MQAAYVYAGMREILKYVNKYYNQPIIYITESGVDVPGESDLPLLQSLNDTFRIAYFQVRSKWQTQEALA